VTNGSHGRGGKRCHIKAALERVLASVKDAGEVVITERDRRSRVVPRWRATRSERSARRLIPSGALRPPTAPRRQLGFPKVKRGAGKAVLQALLARGQILNPWFFHALAPSRGGRA
jgi:hypothetical protein